MFYICCTYVIYIENQGGISNGEIINMRIAFKPTSTIAVSSISFLILAPLPFLSPILKSALGGVNELSRVLTFGFGLPDN